MFKILLICLALYLIMSLLLILYFMGESGTIGRIWEWDEFKRNIPKGKDWFKFAKALFYFIPFYALVRVLSYRRKV